MYEAICAAASWAWLHRYRTYIPNIVRDQKSKVQGLRKRPLESLETLRGYHPFKNLLAAADVTSSCLHDN